jgi:hypothetical protein
MKGKNIWSSVYAKIASERERNFAAFCELLGFVSTQYANNKQQRNNITGKLSISIR